MPKLVLVNGPPGVGKSTLARRYAGDHPLTLSLEIDAIRAMVGCWLEEWSRSGPQARRLALAMARAHLGDGHDAVVPQLLTRREFVTELQAFAESVRATFHEITLLDAKDALLARVESRSQPNRAFSARAGRKARQLAGGGIRPLRQGAAESPRRGGYIRGLTRRRVCLAPPPF